jgi:hypothetical protein
MAKMHKPSGALPAGAEDKEPAAAEALATGHFRKARDLYKELCKRDRPRFLGKLIEANRGLALQMIQKGQCSEASQVRDYLKTIAPAEVLHELDLELALKQQHWPETLRVALALWRLPSGSQRGALLADAIVLASPSLDEVAGFPEPLATEAALILGALEELSASRFEALAEKLRPLSTASIFAVWKTFLKGVAAFHSGATEKAQTLFKKLPEGSVASRASQAYAFFVAGENALEGATPQVQTQMLQGSLRLLGQTAYGPALSRAQDSWKAGRHKDSYKELRAVATFPSLEAGLGCALSDFYFKGCTSLDERGLDSFLRYSEHLLFEGVPKSDQEAFCITRLQLAASIKGYSLIHPKVILQKLELHYKGSSFQIGELLSLGYYRAAEFVIQETAHKEAAYADQEELAYLRTQLLELLEKSIAANPLHLAPHLALVSARKKYGEKVEAFRQIQALCEQFPREKDIFLLAGQAHLDAVPQDHEAAAACFETALSLDCFNVELLETLACSRTHAAAKAYASGDTAKGRLHFELLEPHLLEQSEHFDRSRELARIRQGVLENLFGDKKKGSALIEGTLAVARFKPALLLFQHACVKIWSRRLDAQKTLLKNLEQHPPQSAGERASLLAMLLRIRQLSHPSRLTCWTDEHRVVVNCLMPVAGEAFSETECASLLPQLAEGGLLLPLAKAIAKAGMRRAPDRILFKVAHYALTTRHFKLQQKRTLEKYRKNATAAGDREALQWISTQLRSLFMFSFSEHAEDEEPPAPRRRSKKKQETPAEPTKKTPAKKAKPSASKSPKKPAPSKQPSVQLDLL